ncbi:DUF2945 domain-containing protein [Stenotrophomonas acidaminiphila]|uniref:DUF2945 domain-containing protein n=1 Tax=Stenotrophomonas acidaminiphila TaxID=128780 RepID=UPI0030B86B75
MAAGADADRVRRRAGADPVARTRRADAASVAMAVPVPVPGTAMGHAFKLGDHVPWASEAGHVTGAVIRAHARDTAYRGHVRRCSEDDRQCENRSDRSDHVAMHRGTAPEKTGRHGRRRHALDPRPRHPLRGTISSRC